MIERLLRRCIPFVLRDINIEHLDRLPVHGPFLLAANHVSYLEPILLSALLRRQTNQRVYAFTKFSIWRLFHFFGLSDFFGMVPVDKKHRDRCIDICLERLKQGFPILVFPEGTRSRDGRLGEGKTGAVRLALRAHVPIIPVAYLGPPTRTTLATLRVFARERTSLRLRIGDPFRVAEMPVTHEFLKQETAGLMTSISLLLTAPKTFL